MNIDRRDGERPGDPAVDRSWRAAATDEPSAQLDATILAAARAATDRPQPASGKRASDRWWSHWQPLAAAAGVAGLAFSIVQMLPRDQDVRLEPAFEAVQSERAEVTAQDSTAAPAAPTAPAESAAAMEREAVPQSAAAAKGAPSTLALPVAPAARDAAVPSAESDAYAARGLSRTARQSPELPTPDAWAQRIEALHAAGDRTAAAEELRAFRAAYRDADQYLPEVLQPWAATLESPSAPGVTPD